MRSGRMSFFRENCTFLYISGQRKVGGEWVREGSQRGRERETVCACERIAIKQTLKSNQLSCWQLCRPKHLSHVRLYNIQIKRTARIFKSFSWKVHSRIKVAEMTTMFRYPVFPHLQGELSQD